MMTLFIRWESWRNCRSKSSAWIGASVAGALALVTPASSGAASARTLVTEPARWSAWEQSDFPFFSSIVDARTNEEGPFKDNLTPRAIVLNLGLGQWAAFDTELLRIAAIWDGAGVTPLALSQISYQDPFKKTSGKGPFPAPEGELWLANGVYPGWQFDRDVSLVDPRPPGPSPEEVGRGPLAPENGTFRGLSLTGGGARLEYVMGGATIHEWIDARSEGERRVVVRRFRVAPTARGLSLIVARKFPPEQRQLVVGLTSRNDPRLLEVVENDQGWSVYVPPHEDPIEFVVSLAPRLDSTTTPAIQAAGRGSDVGAPSRWPGFVETRGVLSTAADAIVSDHVELPLENPWRRNVRLADITFFPNGRAAAVTFDGDVWQIDGLVGELLNVRWRRFASGLHEPLSLVIREGEIFVFDRNGIWRLRDTNGDDEADAYEMFFNGASQTADTREFPNSMKLAPDGSFIISKGGQRGLTAGMHSGSVIRVAPDGRSFATLGWGFRQPFVGVHPQTGFVTASDQEGNYVPATPIYEVGDGAFHGFRLGAASFVPEDTPVAEPILWMPRTLNPSGTTQLWVTDARAGPLENALVHVGYHRPELFLVRFHRRTALLQAAVTSLTTSLRFSPLNAALNPVDGSIYVAGFQVYSSNAEQVSGLARIRSTGRPFLLPREVVAMDKGLLLSFDVALDPAKATNPANYLVSRWNYRRKSSYGSPHFRPDGALGQEPMIPSSAYLSRDGKRVLLGIPDMQAGVMQMRVGWMVASADGLQMKHEAYLTPRQLARFEPVLDGFQEVKVDLTPRFAPSAEPDQPATAREGKRLADALGCLACHSIDGSPRVGPSWKALAGSPRPMRRADSIIADDDYLRESILNSGARVVSGFDEGMPSYAGILNDSQVNSLVLYIKSL